MSTKIRVAFYLGIGLIGFGFLLLPDSIIRTLIIGGIVLYLPSAIIFQIVNVGMMGKAFPVKQGQGKKLPWLNVTIFLIGLTFIIAGFLIKNINLSEIGVASLICVLQFRIDDKSTKMAILN